MLYNIHTFLVGTKLFFYGSLELSNALTLRSINKGNIRKDPPEGDDEQNHEESAKYVNYKALKDSGDGTMFYDKDNHIVVIKINGKWMRLAIETLPEGVTYDF